MILSIYFTQATLFGPLVRFFSFLFVFSEVINPHHKATAEAHVVVVCCGLDEGWLSHI